LIFAFPWGHLNSRGDYSDRHWQFVYQLGITRRRFIIKQRATEQQAMPDPLVIKRPDSGASPGVGFLVSVVILGPIAGLLYLWRTGKEVHFDNPRINLVAHMLIVIVPLIWSALIWAEPFRTKASEETSLARSSYFNTLKVDWWMSFMMWACPLFALGALGYLATSYLPHADALSTSLLSAVSTMGLILALGVFYGAMLFTRAETRISDEGMRNGLLNFYEWESIDHFSREGDIYSIHHKANPALPASTFRLRTPASQATLERFAAEKSVPILEGTGSALATIKIAVIIGFILNIVFCLVLMVATRLDLRWIVAISLGIGLLFTLVLERVRGVSKYTKVKPKIAADS